MVQVLPPNIQFYLIVIIQLHACSSKTYTGPTAIRVWTDYLRSLVQQQIAIVKLRTVLRTIVLRCATCPKRRAETLSPMMADLPRERLAFWEPLFTNTGIDFFGPFYVSVKRSTEKRWGFRFTCLTSRAVLFEVVPSMDTSSCVIGKGRFTACRSIPSVLWSNNGTNFIASDKELLRNISHWNL